MGSRIDTKKLMEYCRVPVHELEHHPDSRITLKIFDPTEKLYVYAADMMIDEVVAHNKAGAPTTWVLPAGPNDQYKYFALEQWGTFERPRTPWGYSSAAYRPRTVRRA